MKKRIINKLNLTRLFSKSQTPNFPIDIIVPVYNGYEYLSPLFESIYNNTDLDYNLIVVNDASPDKKVLPLLNKYQKKFGNKMTLINNETNRGFIFSVNTALKTIKNHCVLVNTDVVLPKNWASKLFTPIYLDKKVASVTPFSNNATIFSLPKMNENELLGDLEEINKTLSVINTPFKKIKLPTGVGFCMAMNKNAIQKVGLIDEIFGRGYCEENDWCMRAIKHGFYNTIAANLLVWHKHGASFGSEKQNLIKTNERILLNRHPKYHSEVHKSLKDNKFLSLRFFGELLYLKTIAKNIEFSSLANKKNDTLYIEIEKLFLKKRCLTYKYNDIYNKIILSKKDLKKLNLFLKQNTDNNKPDCNNDYFDWVYDIQTNKSHFTPITSKPFKRKHNTPKIFAYYLTQYHAIPENDIAHGKGFTEWTNVASATPQFIGHYQPKIPYDLGFYNLLDINIMKRQAELANMYGVYGWCFYYYWFSGKKVLEKPLENFLKSDIDLHFHFCWANENWSKLWDGGNKEIILEQKLTPNDAEKFFDDLLPFIKDKRYEKIDNKPLFCIYKPELFDKDILIQFMNKLNELAKQNGFDGFYFMANNVQNFNKPYDYGFNGIIEFPPHGLWDKGTTVPRKKLFKNSTFMLKDLSDYINKQEYLYPADYEIFKACFPGWDNCPRKTYSYGYCFLMKDGMFEKWLHGIIKWTKKNNAENKQYIYINAWNEWGEGAILEPTKRFGYKNLDIIKRELEKDV